MSYFLLGALGFIVMIVVVVGIHEFGHFATAKWSGIRVDEFAIGFGPRLWSRRRGETVYSLRALPIGGFVKMPGMSALEQDDGGERGFMHAPAWRRLVVLLAGVTMNFILAGVLFGVLRTQTVDAGLIDNLPAAASGLHSGDHVAAVNGGHVDPNDTQAVSDALHNATDGSPGAPVDVEVRRSDGSVASAVIKPALVVIDLDDSQRLIAADGHRVYQLVVDTVDGKPVPAGDAAKALGGEGGAQITGHEEGASPSDPSAQVKTTLRGVTDGRDSTPIGHVEAAWYIGYTAGSLGESVPVALARGFTSLPSEVASRVHQIYDVLTVPNSGGISNFQGPVGIAKDSAQAAGGGWSDYIFLVGLISLSLGIINLLPLPPFDGGRVALLAVEVVRRRNLAARAEVAFIAVGAALVVALALFITYNDIRGF